MGADLFVFTEQWGFPVKACSLASHTLLTLWPERPGVSHRFVPSAAAVS